MSLKIIRRKTNFCSRIAAFLKSIISKVNVIFFGMCVFLESIFKSKALSSLTKKRNSEVIFLRYKCIDIRKMYISGEVSKAVE